MKVGGYMKFLEKSSAKKQNNSDASNDNSSDPVLLKTTADEFAFLLIKGVLEDNKIPYMTKDSGAGGILRIRTGSETGSRKDIYVSRNDYEKSRDLIYSVSDKNE